MYSDGQSKPLSDSIYVKKMFYSKMSGLVWFYSISPYTGATGKISLNYNKFA